jgi:hypothetical protein
MRSSHKFKLYNMTFSNLSLDFAECPLQCAKSNRKLVICYKKKKKNFICQGCTKYCPTHRRCKNSNALLLQIQFAYLSRFLLPTLCHCLTQIKGIQLHSSFTVAERYQTLISRSFGVIVNHILIEI